jgi:hypothetical protein
MFERDGCLTLAQKAHRLLSELDLLRIDIDTDNGSIYRRQRQKGREHSVATTDFQNLS